MGKNVGGSLSVYKGCLFLEDEQENGNIDNENSCLPTLPSSSAMNATGRPACIRLVSTS